MQPETPAEKIRREDPYLVDYLLGWCGLAEPQPWGAATSFALEVAYGYGLIVGESDATPTPLGRHVTAALRTRDSDSNPQGENAERSGAVEGEALQSGGKAASPNPSLTNPPVGADAVAELLPCPFCGKNNVKVFGPYGWYRQWGISHSCSLFYSGAQEMAQGFGTKAGAIEAWNTRAALNATFPGATGGTVQSPREAVETASRATAQSIAKAIRDTAAEIRAESTDASDALIGVAEGIEEDAEKTARNLGDNYARAAPLPAATDERELFRIAEREEWSIAPQVNGGWVIEKSEWDFDDGREVEIARTRGSMVEALRIAADHEKIPLPAATDSETRGVEGLAKAATKARFALRLATVDQRNGYEVGWYEGYLAARPTNQEEQS